MWANLEAAPVFLSRAFALIELRIRHDLKHLIAKVCPVHTCRWWQISTHAKPVQSMASAYLNKAMSTVVRLSMIMSTVWQSFARLLATCWRSCSCERGAGLFGGRCAWLFVGPKTVVRGQTLLFLGPMGSTLHRGPRWAGDALSLSHRGRLRSRLKSGRLTPRECAR